MMGNYGYGMNPGMMGGYGMGIGPKIMGYYSPEQYEKQYKKFQGFLNDTRELRKKLHTLKFDFAEAQRNPNNKRDDLEKINTEMESVWKQIYEKKKSVFK
jgi:peptidoglycan hydrolase CwlO-like protein